MVKGCVSEVANHAILDPVYVDPLVRVKCNCELAILAEALDLDIKEVC